MKIEVNADKRTLQGKGASRRLRASGKLPGIIYGGDGEPQSIELDHNDMFHKLELEAFHASILTLNIDGNKEQVLLRDVQMHPYKSLVLHVDFQRVDPKKKIHMKVPLHFINADVAPGVKTSGGIVTHVITEVDVTCLPKDLPEFITVDLIDLDAGHTMHLSDIEVPENVEITALAKGDDQAMVTITIPRAVLSSEETEAEAGEDEGDTEAEAESTEE